MKCKDCDDGTRRYIDRTTGLWLHYPPLTSTEDVPCATISATSTGANQHAAGLRRGVLLASIEGARSLLSIAKRSADLLSVDDRKSLSQVEETLGGIEQRLW